MATHKLDARGLKCPQPTLKLTQMAMKLPSGEIIDVMADCPTFEADLKGFAGRMKKTILWIKPEGGATRAHVRL